MNSNIELLIPVGSAGVAGELIIPDHSRGLVLFAHGSGSSRHSPRNQRVAGALQSACFATLLMDLLTQKEETIDAYGGQIRFDIELLAHRLIAATDWVQANEIGELPTGYFGASTGAAATLAAGAARPQSVKAIVSRGGRPDLAGSALDQVRAPTLLIVGSLDSHVIELNRQAYAQLSCEKKLEIVPGAGHLFEEPGKLDIVAELASNWFQKYLAPKTM